MRARSAGWSVALLALALPLLGPLGCASAPPPFMGSAAAAGENAPPAAWHPSPGQSLKTAATQVAIVVGGAVLLVGGTLLLIWVWLLTQRLEQDRAERASEW